MRIEEKGISDGCFIVKVHENIIADDLSLNFDKIALKAAELSARGVIFDAGSVKNTPGVYETYRLITNMEIFRKRGLKAAFVFGRGGFDNSSFAADAAANRCIEYETFEEIEKAKEWMNTRAQ